ncbi:hypothetical protein HK405_012644, partial [Cladochytrium tenue]
MSSPNILKLGNAFEEAKIGETPEHESSFKAQDPQNLKYVKSGGALSGPDARAQSPTNHPLEFVCASCGGELKGPHVRALGRMYHLEHFVCTVCNTPIAKNFYETEGKVYCRFHYFQKLELICASCGGELKGPHVRALGRTYHLEHFVCTACGVVIRENDSYYEREGGVYCQAHYLQLFASRCGGCRTFVTKKYVEMKVKEDVMERWHPECYTMFKLYNVRVVSPKPSDPHDTEDEIRIQLITQEKVSRIYDILVAFEESSAECIVDMMAHFSRAQYQEGVIDAARLLAHVSAIFASIDRVRKSLVSFGEDVRVKEKMDPKHLARAIVGVFSLLSTTKDAGAKREFPTDLATRVKSLATMLKSQIRVALSGALTLENKYNSVTAVDEFLEQLTAVADPSEILGHVYLSELSGTMRSDLCVGCDKPVEAACYNFIIYCWHGECFRCKACQKDLTVNVADARFDRSSRYLSCQAHESSTSLAGGQALTQLQFYAFLLVGALKRLASLLNVAVDATILRASERAAAAAAIEPVSRGIPDSQLGTTSRDPLEDQLDQYASDFNERFHHGNTLTAPQPPSRKLPANARFLSEVMPLDSISMREEAARQLQKHLGRFLTAAEILECANAQKQQS